MNWGLGLLGFLADRWNMLPQDGKKRRVYVNGKMYWLEPGIMKTAKFRRMFKIPKKHTLFRVWYGYRNIPQEITMTCGYIEHGNQGRRREEFNSR